VAGDRSQMAGVGSWELYRTVRAYGNCALGPKCHVRTRSKSQDRQARKKRRLFLTPATETKTGASDPRPKDPPLSFRPASFQAIMHKKRVSS